MSDERPADGQLKTLATWAKCLTASADKRRAAISALVDEARRDEAALNIVASIRDPLGIQIRSQERARAWASTQSEILKVQK